MATYEEIYGKRVKEFDSDPTLESSYEGQVWYDKSTGVLKSVVAFESVTAGSNLGTARNGLAGAGSSQIQGGGSTPSTPSSTTSQEFTAETTALNVKTLTQS